MIIALFDQPINAHSSKSWVQGLQGSLDDAAKHLGVTSFREYRLVLDYKEHVIRVPLVKEGQARALLWPAGMFGRRSYPLAAYLFAVCTYIAGGLSMRQVALITRKQFGLDQFSHSTICRAKKRLLRHFGDLKGECLFDPLSSSGKNHPPMTNSLIGLLRELLDGVLKEPFLHGERLARYFFLRYQVFLL